MMFSPHFTPGLQSLQRLGWGVALSFMLKGLVITGLIVFAALRMLDVF